MTPQNLAADLKKRLEQEINAATRKQFHVYEQVLPPREIEDDVSCFPYLLIVLGDGEENQDTATQRVTLIMAYLEDADEVEDEQPKTEFSGYMEINHVIQLVRQSFADNPCLSSFRLQHPVKWVFADEETYPYFFGGMELTFEIPKLLSGDRNT